MLGKRTNSIRCRLRETQIEVLEGRYLLTAFSEQPAIYTAESQRFSDFLVADLDADGGVELVVASPGVGTINVHRQSPDGYKEIVASDSASGVSSVALGDLNGDGLHDIIWTSPTENRLAWAAQLANGEFGERQTIDDSEFGVSVCTATDFDGDGDIDVLAASNSHGWITFYENQSGLFRPPRLVGRLEGVKYIEVGELNGDELPDLVALSESGEIATILNQDSLSVTVVGQADRNAEGLFVEDVNADGTLDLISS